MFRIQDNVPEVYVEESRDFQLFARIYDFAFQSCKLRADSLQYSNDPKHCDESLLELLQTKVGLFDKLNVNTEDLRKILAALPSIIPYKGSLKGIQSVVNLYLRLCSVKSSSIINPTPSTYVIELSTDAPLKNVELLYDLMYFIIPSGFRFEYYQSTIEQTFTKFGTSDLIEYKVTPREGNSTTPLYRTIVSVSTELEPYDSKFDIVNIPELATAEEVL